MSSKIDGVPRELLEDMLNPCADFATHDRLRALLDAPVVECQQPEPVGVLMLGEVFNGTQGLELDDWDVDWYRKPIDELNAANPGAQLKLYVEPPELAELQATIAQLETKLNNAINLDFERRKLLKHFAACADVRQVGTAAMDYVASFSEPATRPSHVDAPADCGTHPHNDGLDDYREPNK